MLFDCAYILKIAYCVLSAAEVVQPVGGHVLLSHVYQVKNLPEDLKINIE